MIASALLVAAFIVQVINYEVVMEFDNPASWSVMMDEKCGKGASNDAYQARSLSDFGQVALIWGGFYGFLF